MRNELFCLEGVVANRPTREERVKIKNFVLNYNMNSLKRTKAGFSRRAQSVLSMAAYSLDLEVPYLKEEWKKFKKSCLLELIGNHIEPRNAIFFQGGEYSKHAEKIEEMLRKEEAIYLKEDGSLNGRGIYRIKYINGIYHIEYPNGEISRLLRIRNFSFKEQEKYIAEPQISIAKSFNRSWEIRIVYPYAQDFIYTKLAKCSTSYLNNASCGGIVLPGIDQTIGVLTRIIYEQSKRQSKDITKIRKEAETFIEEAISYAKRTKALTDALQTEIGKNIFYEDDFKEENRNYQDRITTASEGIFLIVDITGVWDKEKQKLIPKIIEAQTGGGLLEESVDAANRIMYNGLKERFKMLQSYLNS